MTDVDVRGLTLMAVHAHPDDESALNGGILAHCSDRGIRTVLVTCTDGRLGDAPGLVKPGEPDHDPDTVARLREVELRTACAHLGVSRIEPLGYPDSGLADWAAHRDDRSFCQIPVLTVATAIAELMRQHRPQVVVTYDPGNVHQHPDHVHAARATAAATEMTGIPAKLYFTVLNSSYWRKRHQAFLDANVSRPAPSTDRLQRAEENDRRITTSIDVSAVVQRKRDALFSHMSQVAGSSFADLPTGAFEQLYGQEHFIRAQDTTGTPVPERDLFAGLL